MQSSVYKCERGLQFMLSAQIVLVTSLAVVVASQIFQAEHWQIALIQSAVMLGMLLSFFYTSLFSRSSLALATIIPHVVTGVLFLATAFVGNRFGFTGLVFAAGIFTFIGQPFYTKFYSVVFSPEDRGRYVSLSRQWGVLASILTSFLFALYADPFTFRIFYFVIGLFSLLVAFWFYRVVRRFEGLGTQTQPSFREFFAVLRIDKAFGTFMLFQFMLGICNLAAVSAFQVYINDENYLDINIENAAIITGMIPFLAMFLVVPLWGRIFDKIPIVWYRAITNIFMGLGIYFYAAFDSVFWLATGTFLWGVGRGGGQLAWTLAIMDFAPPEHVSRYTAVHTFLTGVRGACAPFVSLFVLQSGISPNGIFIFCGSGVILSGVLTVVFVKPKRQRA